MSHTKLPWKQRETTDSHWAREVINEEKIGVAWCGINPIEEAHANAAFIVKAANSHYELVAALEDVKRRIEESDTWWIKKPSRGGFDMDIIEEALAKAKS